MASLAVLGAVAEFFLEDKAPESTHGLIVAGLYGVIGQFHGNEEGLHRRDAEDVIAEANVAQQLFILRGGDALPPEITPDESGKPPVFFPKFPAQTAFIPCHRFLSVSSHFFMTVPDEILRMILLR